jgi:uncharacterized protein YukE
MTAPGTPRDVELAAVVDQDELIERADRWTILAGTLARIHENLAPGATDLRELWVGQAADTFFDQLGPLLDTIRRLGEQMTTVRNALLSVQEGAVPVRQALYRDVLGWQRDLAGVDADERRDPVPTDRFAAQRAAVTERWAARADVDAGPLTDALAAGAAALAAIEPVRPTFTEPDSRPPS